MRLFANMMAGHALVALVDTPPTHATDAFLHPHPRVCRYAVPHIPWKRLAEQQQQQQDAGSAHDWRQLVGRLLALVYAVGDLTLPVLSKPQVGAGWAWAESTQGGLLLRSVLSSPEAAPRQP